MPSKTITETEVKHKFDVIDLGELVTEEEQAFASANKDMAIVVIVSNRGERYREQYLQRIEIDGNTCYKVIDNETAIEKIQALFDARKAEAEKKKRSEGADSLLALANTQPAATATTNASPSQAPPSLSNDTDIVHVCDFVDLTRSD